MKLALLLAALVAAFVVPSTAQAWTITTNPTSVEQFAYAAGSGHSPSTGNLPWVQFDVRSSDYPTSHNIGQSNPSGLNGWQKQWDDGASLGATEGIDNDSDLRVRFQLGSSGKAQGTYATTWRFTASAASNSPLNVTLTAYVQPWNQCTDGLDNDGDLARDWRKGAGGSQANADSDCTGMTDTTEGGGAPPPTAPAAPTNLSASCGDGQATVGWNDNANNEVDYLVQRSTNQTNWTDTTAPANSTSKVVTGLTNGTLYYFRVAARNSAGTVYGSTPGPLACAPQLGSPAAPSGLDATSVDTDTVNLTWTDNSSNETGFTVQRSTSSDMSNPTTLNTAANATSLTDNGVTGNGSTTYYYRVRADRTGAASSAFTEIDPTTPPPPDNVPPASVATVTATANSSTAITVDWNDVATEDGYRVEIDDNSGFSSPTSVAKGANVVSHQFTGLTASTQYFFRVRSFNTAGGDSPAWSPTATATTQGAGGSWWKPVKTEGPWYWQLEGSVNMTRANTVNIIDVDPDQTPQSVVASWKAGNPNRRAICYFSAGTYEPFRTDAGSIPVGARGEPVQGFEEERWLDIRNQDIRPVMQARMQRCKNEGYDAVEPDNVDGYDNTSGFPLTAADQITYNEWLADTAHSLGLGAFLKNDLAQIPQLVDNFDGAVNEQCQEFAECADLDPFLNANKPVLQAEYHNTSTAACGPANLAGRWAAYHPGDFSLGNGRWDPCWD